MSADGSVLGSYDDRGNAENDASGRDEDTEEMFVDLSKSRPKD